MADETPVPEFAEPHADDPVYERIAAEMRDHVADDATGHDLQHAWRVFVLGDRIARAEGADRTVVRVAALVHDLHRVLDGGVPPEECLDEVAAVLDAADAPAEHREDVLYAVEVHDRYDYRGDPPAETPEAAVLQDADNLDATGAVGVARCFAFTGAHGNPLWTPDDDRPSAVDHVYEKLLNLPGEMNTEAGERVAAERHDFLLRFVERFEAEWRGRDAE